MYFEEPRSEKHPLRFALVLAAALAVNAAIGAMMLDSGADGRIARGSIVAPRIVADLGTLPEIVVRGCRTTA